MNSVLVDVLREAMHIAKEAAMGRGGPLSEFVFTTKTRGVLLDDRRVREVFARILRNAGLPAHHTPHCLRHSFCTLLLAEGVPVTYVMAQAGHSSIDITVRYYGRWIPKSDRSLIDRINAKLAPAGSALVAGSSQVVSNGVGIRNCASNSEGGALRPSIHAENSSDSARRSPARSVSARCHPSASRWPRSLHPLPPVNPISLSSTRAC